MSRPGSRKVRELVEWATDNGWTVEKTNGGHLRYTHPDVKMPVFGAHSPSDHRSVRNMRARLKRALRGDPL